MSSIGPVPSGEIVLYEAPDGQVRLDVRLERETVWLTQAQMAELFGRERPVITRHVNNVFGEGELAKESNVQNLHIAPWGNRRVVIRVTLNLLGDDGP